MAKDTEKKNDSGNENLGKKGVPGTAGRRPPLNEPNQLARHPDGSIVSLPGGPNERDYYEGKGFEYIEESVAEREARLTDEREQEQRLNQAGRAGATPEDYGREDPRDREDDDEDDEPKGKSGGAKSKNKSATRSGGKKAAERDGADKRQGVTSAEGGGTPEAKGLAQRKGKKESELPNKTSQDAAQPEHPHPRGNDYELTGGHQFGTDTPESPEGAQRKGESGRETEVRAPDGTRLIGADAAGRADEDRLPSRDPKVV